MVGLGEFCRMSVPELSKHFRENNITQDYLLGWSIIDGNDNRFSHWCAELSILWKNPAKLKLLKKQPKICVIDISAFYYKDIDAVVLNMFGSNGGEALLIIKEDGVEYISSFLDIESRYDTVFDALRNTV